ncbi:hypothetical protein [Yinghuangia seranimata]|uniref:hypothetical protein n=1 Tax=Yinghuangia seranimata TaxID=408067 RepID=UPI00248C57E5|nr:hypothetical protein [Yinghuangia seranimata]MDI2127561.1 hypothetical protein [Yinghuangia seranimata]
MLPARLRSAAAAVSLVPLLFAASACKIGGDDKDAKGGTGGGKADPAAAAQPAAGSGAPSGGGSSGAAVSGGGAAKALTADQLKAALLVQSDMPSGWTVKPGSTVSPSKLNATPAGCQAIVDLVSGDPKAAPTATGNGVLTNGSSKDAQYFVSMEQYSGVATKLLDDVVKETGPGSSCGTVNATDGDNAFIYKAARSDRTPKSLGDAVLYLDITTSQPGQSAELPGRMQIVRSGEVLIQFVGMQKSGKPEWVPDAVVKAQVEKIKAAQK